MKQTLYRHDFASYYDSIYVRKDYVKEVDFIEAVRKKHDIRGKNLLDVGCGTGNHASVLVKKGYDVTGIDQSPDVLSVATKKVPRATFKRADMKTFNLRARFDVIIGLFSVINYNTNRRDLVRTLRNFRRHLQDGGVVIFDFPAKGKSQIGARFFRKNRSAVLQEVRNESDKTFITTYVLVGTTKNAKVFKEVHEVKAHSLAEFARATKRAGLNCRVYWDFSLRKTKGVRPVMVCRA